MTYFSQQSQAHLWIEFFATLFQEDMHYTPYSVISYIIAGHRSVNKVKMKFIPINKDEQTNSKKRKKTSNGGDKDDKKINKKANFDLVISSDSEFDD